MKKPLALIILDGFGYNPQTYGNAIVAAETPTLDRLLATCPHTLIGASGLDVGLPQGQMGNSEVGHTNIGAGRVVYQELTRITKSIQEGDFFQNPALTGAMEHCQKTGGALHLMGLCSDGGVHSHITHLYGLLELAKRWGLRRVYVHCFMDGRDVPPTSGRDYLAAVEAKMNELGIGRIATVIGRYYAMDRDNRWERVVRAYDAIVNGEGIYNPSAVDAAEKSYGGEVTDEFIEPCVCLKDAGVQDGDSIIFYNFRPDRARELTRAFVDPAFTGFERKGGQKQVYYVCMTQYDATMPHVQVAFAPEALTNTLGEYVSKLGMTQLRIAETEKYAHVTFFFNGGVEAPYPGEDRVLIPSPKVATYDLQPQMSAYEVTEEVVRRVESGKYDLIVLNYANCDMVGHTGVFEAAKKAVEAVDTCLGRTLEAILKMGGRALVTADHGNADQMFEPDGSPFTAHTTNPVPLIAVGCGEIKLREGGRLADLAPTLLELWGLPQPPEMTGHSLLEN
ncbi:MAG TPA: 2,3-bisphosphoglycerate-independent phosphoglycerate mutase [Candidatus Anaerotruncus excrementipullorum]|uniref:2,3-bisphosphoglycerate-independent phosphoglycerate mutase n=1 Tax=Candidatus Anaerotruncus excrementipullorum TaxID=2838465 RepID=A0A9D1WQT8_9FIRM|nr:2,3-bisphosphoglycerate-independent phosphoglycerate mutase [Candidatus Anaerotruncus excrementipullorum]